MVGLRSRGEVSRMLCLLRMKGGGKEGMLREPLDSAVLTLGL